jgi:hypothetical protein
MVQLSSGTNGTFEYHIYNMTGQEVIDGYYTGEVSIDISGLEKGMYFVELLNNENRVILKLIKE